MEDVKVQVTDYGVRIATSQSSIFVDRETAKKIADELQAQLAAYEEKRKKAQEMVT